ncbi:MAG: hypothetical protein KC621_27525, partial [Myxococcales bacterium]|nr:hypothetical protein [Myxococcales bacterium]
LIVAAVVVCLVLLGVAGWVFLANSDEARLRTEVDHQSAELARCRPSSEVAEIVLVLTVEDHRTRSVTVSGDPGGRIGRCAERVLERRRWSVDGPITVEVPVQFR